MIYNLSRKIEKTEMITNEIFQRTPQQDILTNVVFKYFSNTNQEELLTELVQMFTQINPIHMQIGRYNLLINTKKQYVLMDNLERILDYFSLIRNSTGVKNSFAYHSLDETQYGAVSDTLVKNGGQYYPLSFVMWQIVSQLLEKNLVFKNHQLQFKARFMPNFAIMGETPAYMNFIIAGCLTTPKTITELKHTFPYVSEDVLNRIFLLSILSGVADRNVLLVSHKNQQSCEYLAQHESKKKIQASQKTKDIQRAKKTGFFQRLLQKLRLPTKTVEGTL